LAGKAGYPLKHRLFTWLRPLLRAGDRGALDDGAGSAERTAQGWVRAATRYAANSSVASPVVAATTGSMNASAQGELRRRCSQPRA